VTIHARNRHAHPDSPPVDLDRHLARARPFPAQPDWYTPLVLPKARAVHAAVLDVQRGQVVLFGRQHERRRAGRHVAVVAAGGWTPANPATSPTGAGASTRWPTT
jgi:hypothetical protein